MATRLHLRSVVLGFLVLLSVQSCYSRNIPQVLQSLDERSNSTEPTEPMQGWTDGPNTRGTLDIIWSSVFTIFLCSWSVLCVQVPAVNEDDMVLFRRKLYLFILGIAGPEFTLLLAMGQFMFARRSFKAFRASNRESNRPEWTMNHSFFADMGGFLLKAPDMPAFPIDGLQIHYLVTNGYLEYPTLDKRTIGDRNKTDTLVRVITIFQTLWFTINCIARTTQHLALTTLELTALAFIPCTLATTFCWANKPADVSRPIILEITTPISTILLKAGSAASQPYRNTPLDFVSRQEWSWSLYWQFWRSFLRGMHIIFYPRVRPIPRFPNDNFPEPGPWGLLAFFFFSTGYASIFLAGWNFVFATQKEQTLWRIASLASMAAMVVTWITDTVVFRMLPGIRRETKRSLQRASSGFAPSSSPSSSLSPNLEVEKAVDSQGHDNSHGQTQTKKLWFAQTAVGRRIYRVANFLRNTSSDKDPEYTVPLRALLPVTFSGVLYLICRSYLLVEDFVGLRSLPKSAYDMVDWAGMIPHLCGTV
ncbi:hypothetical protein BCR34DRAFT_572522 [Clohesyomyces aquaticus]|uniref:Uncharacterized protein n=1 Tax=Clohesyomyces aquaticus TaxID=1231657 RepID=A0A1Y1Z315_9PLEO|nr:hypothetical protein BCR34DRAFT_572522 [Clohesyomyces aquaticus]